MRWDKTNNQFNIINKVIEPSGTKSLRTRSIKQPPWGSFHGHIQTVSKQESFFDAIGTGQIYKHISNDISFRFPVPKEDFIFSLSAENSVTGIQETVLVENLKIESIQRKPLTQKITSEFYNLKNATKTPSLEFVIYSEGYKSQRKNHFLLNATRTVDILRQINFPNFENINFKAVFKESNLTLDTPYDYGNAPIKRDSAYGLYYLYWHKFGRWYDVIYPTNEELFRSAMSEIPYDYNFFLVDSSRYWGVGNYKTHTAVPVDSGSFVYLLIHELGHYFGLNEEYDGGGSTDSNKGRNSYKPGLSCIMENGPKLCDVCMQGIADVIKFDLGM